MAGGTGGHIFPALSVAEYLRAQGWNVVWLGSRAGMEARLVPPKGYTMAWIRFSGVRGKGSCRCALLPLNLLIAFWQSARAIFAHRPDVVLGMGGYVAFPGGMMASLLQPPARDSRAELGRRARRTACSRGSRTACSSRFPNAFRARIEGGMDRQSGARRYRRACAARGALRGPRRAAAAARARRQPGRAGAERSRAASARAACREQRVRRSRIRPARRTSTRCARAYAARGRRGERGRVHRRHGGALRRGRSDDLPRGRIDDRRACRGRRARRCWCRFRTRWTITRRTTRAFWRSAARAILIPQAELTPEKLARSAAELDREKLLAMARAARAAGKPDATRAVAEACMKLAA